MTTSWSLDNLRAEVRSRMGLSTNDTALSGDRLAELINAAQRKMSLVHDWPWLIEEDTDFTALTIGQQKYSVTVPNDNWRKTLNIVIDEDQVLRAVQPAEIFRYLDSEAERGRPSVYAISGTDIYFAPAPDQAYSVKHVYVKEVTTMSAGSDLATVEDWAIDALVDLACVQAAKRLRDFEMARMFMEEYALMIESLRDEVRRTRQPVKPRRRTDVAWP